MGVESVDFDLALGEDPSSLARTLAKQLGGHFFFLDAVRRQSRVLVQQGGMQIQFDFAPFRAETLEGDLRLRDFTLNAMALDLRSDGLRILDPCEGRADLESRLIRVCSPCSFTDDPLRLLRALRLRHRLGMSLEPGTLELIRRDAPLIEGVAAERVRSELALSFLPPKIHKLAAELADCGLLQALWALPEPVEFSELRDQLQDFEARLEALKALDTRDILTPFLAAPLEQGLSLQGLLCLACLSQALGVETGQPPRLPVRFSNRTHACFEALMKAGGEDLDMSAVACNVESRALWVQSFGAEPGASARLVYALLQRPPFDEGCAQVFRALEDYGALDHGRAVKPLIDGHGAARLGFQGHRIAGLLLQLRQARIRGEIATSAEAETFAMALAEKLVDK